MAEREVEAAAISIRDSVVCVDTTSSVELFTSKAKFITINDPDNRPLDVSYCTFCSSLNHHIVDPRVPNAIHLLIFFKLT